MRGSGEVRSDAGARTPQAVPPAHLHAVVIPKCYERIAVRTLCTIIHRYMAPAAKKTRQVID
jgi:hypothetical protein